MKDIAVCLLVVMAIMLALPSTVMVSLMLWQQVKELYKEVKDEKAN